MKIKCTMLDAEDFDLTYGKVYEVEKVLDGMYKIKDDVGESSYMKEGEFEVVEEESTEWSGKGLPPVGAKVLVTSIFTSLSEEKTIAYLGNRLAIFINESQKETVGEVGDYIFKPIKSEKEKEIDKIALELLESVNKYDEDFQHSEGHIAEHLYNAGLRFTKDSK